MKGLNQIIALLIILAIVVFVATLESGYISDLLVSQSPKGSVLVPFGFRWYSTGKKSMLVDGLVMNMGTYSVNITHVYVYVNGVKYSVDLEGNNIIIKPGDKTELVGWVVVNKLPSTSDVLVEIMYCYINTCNTVATYARIPSSGYLLPTMTITYTAPGSTITITSTETHTYTTTISGTETITYTTTQTVTRTQTITTTQTTTTTTTITKPAWPIQFSACYGADDYVYVEGTLNKPVNKNAEIIPYIVKIYTCSIVACKLKAVVPFNWTNNKTIEASWGPIQLPPLTGLKVEVWGVNTQGELVAKIWESDVDTSVRCA